jgi:FkbM family methyltransferase
MNSIFIRAYSRLLQIIVRIFCRLTGKGGGKFAKFLPKGQRFLIPNYCGNLKFEVDTTYPMESSVWLAGVYDVTTTNFLKKVIHQGDVFLDIGANCGALTLVAASLIGQGKIYAFEPAPAVRSRLQDNIEINPQFKEIVTVVPYGLGRQKYKGFYNEDPNYRGNGSLHGQQGIAVEVFSLDEWVALEKLDKIDLIKIDVEGMEYDVLLGGKAVLEKYHPILYFETLELFFETSSHSIKTTYEFLSSLGYRIIYPTTSYSEIPFEGPYPPNSVAIHSSQAARLRK